MTDGGLDMKHTPGPWSLGIQPKAIVVWGDATMPRTVVARIPNVGYPEHAHHDARLIAAAPDLLDALVRAERAISGYTESSRRECCIEGIRAAIAKATS